MMTRPTHTLLIDAHQLVKSGRKAEAYQLLKQAAQQDPREYRIWLGLAGLVESPEVSLKFIAQAEKLQPGNPKVVQARQWAEQRMQAQPSPPPTPAAAPPVLPAPKLAALPVKRPTPAPPLADVSPPPTELAPAAQGIGRRLLFAAAAGGIIVVMVLAALWLSQGSKGEQPAAAAVISPATLTPTPITAQTDLLLNSSLPIDRSSFLADAATPVRIQAKNIVSQSQEPRLTWTATPIPTSTPTPTNTPTPTPTPYPTYVGEADPISKPAGLRPGERWISVNLTTQTLTAYEGDTVILSSLVSTGRWNTPTVTGQFRIYLRYESQNMDGRPLGYTYYLPNVPHVMYFYGDYAIHGAYWHTNFGNVASHGCVNVNLADAEFLFHWASIGTIVYVHY